MAEILLLPERSAARPARPPGAGPAEIVLFPGVRVEYREPDAPLDLSRRPGRSGRDKAG